MKKLYTFLLLALAATGSSMAQNSGGPDAYGYTWKNDAHPTGPTYNWIDITSTGTPVTGLADDNVVGPFNLGFTFRYYWTDVTRFWIGSNGYIIFGSAGQISSAPNVGFPAIPSAAAPNNFVAPMLSDLNFTQDAGGAPNPAQAFYYTNNTDQAIITFKDVAFWTDNANGWQGSNTFQVILSDADSSITFQYQSQNGSWNASYNNSTNPLVIGIENITGTVGLQVSNNQYPTAQRAIKFYYPASTTFSVTDASVAWIQNQDNKGYFAVTGTPIAMQAAVSNVGNTTIAGTVSARTTVRKASAAGSPAGSNLFDQTETTSNLAPGSTITLNYPNFTVPAQPVGNSNPSYFVQTSLTLTGDLNPGNNTLTNELVIIDPATFATPGEFQLRYDDGTPEAQLGFEGGAVYFKPPVYPVEVRSLEYYLVAAATVTSGYTAKLFADDGPAGSPGTLLYSQTMLSTDVIAGAFNVIPLPTPVNITSGGFYVSWERNGATADVAVAVDRTGPYSFQGYEVLFGVFGEYRSNAEEDIMIRATVYNSSLVSAPGEVSNLSLASIYPNPANNTANVVFSLTEPADVSFQFVNVTGQVVKQLNLGTQLQGEQRLQLPVNELSAGVYFFTMKAGNELITKKFVVTR